jgi:hypothetical protein
MVPVTISKILNIQPKFFPLKNNIKHFIFQKQDPGALRSQGRQPEDVAAVDRKRSFERNSEIR